MVAFIVPRPTVRPMFWALTKPFKTRHWISVLIVLAMQTCYLTTRSWFYPYNSKETKSKYYLFREKIDFNFDNSVCSSYYIEYRNVPATAIELIARLVVPWEPVTPSELKYLMLLWKFFGFFLVSVYSSGLAACLMQLEHEERYTLLLIFMSWILEKSICCCLPVELTR